MRVTNNYIAQQGIKRIQNATEAVYKSDMQVSTGLKGEKYSDVASDLRQILLVSESQSKLESYSKNLTNMESYLESVEKTLQGMQKILTETTELATLALNENTPEARASLASTAEGLAKNLDSLLNTKFQGKYIFSGQATDTNVSEPSSPKVFAGIPASKDYYQGDSESLQTVVGDGIVLEYGITGDDQGFADLKAGIESLWYGLENNDDSSLEGALDLINNAQSGFGSMLGTVGGEMKQVDILQEQNETTKDFLATQLQELQGVDSSKAINELKANEAALDANFMLLARMGKVSLIDYL